MNGTSSKKVRELAQLMTVPDMLAALGGSVSETPSTSGVRPEKDPGVSPSRTGSCGAGSLSFWIGWMVLRGGQHDHHL